MQRVLKGGFEPDTPASLGRSVPTSQKTNLMFITKNRQLRLYKEMIAVCSEIHTKHINTMCGQNVEFFNVAPGGTDIVFTALSILQVTLYPRVYAMYCDIFYLYLYLSTAYLMTPLVAQIRVVERHFD